MMRWIIGSSLKFRRLVIAIAAGLLVFGVLQLDDMRADTLPEFSETTVEVQTEALGLSAEEVEQLITVPLEQDLLNGVAFLQDIESVSLPGLSSVVMTFEPGTDMLDARQVVAERLTQAVGVAGLPQVAKLPQMIQPLSSTSRVGMVKLTSEELDEIDMSVLSRWKIVPRLMGVEGVANVAIWGFRDRQLQVLVDPAHLADTGVTLNQVIRTTANALEVSNLSYVEASSPGTGGFIDTPNQRLHIFHEQAITSPDELARVPIEGQDEALAANGGARTLLGDVADVTENHQPLIGDALCSDADCLLLVVEKFPDANTAEVTEGVEEALEILAPGLGGIEMDTAIYRPAAFVESSVDNLGRALAIGAVLLLIVLAVAFFSWRTALVATAAIVASLGAAWLVLYFSGASMNVMVLAGLVAGLVVLIDDAVTDTHQYSARLGAQRAAGVPAWRALVDAALEMRTALLYATLLIAAVLVPAFFMQGEAGAFLPPMAQAYLLAVVASLVVALTFTPALSMLLLADRPARSESPAMAWARRGTDRLSAASMARPLTAVVVLVVLVAIGIATVPFLDSSFRPSLRERDIQVAITAPPGTSLTRMDEITEQAVAELSALPGVTDAAAPVGRAVTSDRIVNVNSAQVWVNIDASADYADTMTAIESVATNLPDVSSEVMTYSEQRVSDVLGGSDDEVAVRIYGEDPAVLTDKADEIRGILAGIDGVEDAEILTVAEEDTIEIEADIDRAQEFGIKPGDVRRTSATLLSGLTVGNLFDAQKVFDAVVWGVPEIRDTPEDVENMLIDAPGGGHVRLGDVASVSVVKRPTAVYHESVGTYLDVVANVSGRDVGEVSSEVDAAIKEVDFPFEHHAEVLGDFADSQAARSRLFGIAIAVAIAAFLLLQAAFASWRLATFAFLLLPVSLVGGAAAALLLDDGIIGLGAAAGLVTVFALAVRTCITLVRHLQQQHRDGLELGPELVRRGLSERIGAILTSVVGIAAVFVPLAFAGDVAGLEVVQPMAVVVLGGLISSTLLSVVILPAMYLRYGLIPETESWAEEDTDVVSIPDVDPVRG